MLLAAGPKAILRAPFNVPDARGNTGIKTTKRHDVYFPVTKTGTLAKYVFQTKALLADGASYAQGTVANYSWTVEMFRTDGVGAYNPASALFTETFNPNTRQNTDSSGDLNCIILLPNVAVAPGLYVMSFRAVNASPSVDWCSVNHSYYGIDPGMEGANRRLNARGDAADSFYQADGRMMGGTANADGTGQSRPATYQNAAPYAKYTPWYWLIYADGSAEGQPYSGGPALTSDGMNFRFNRKQTVTHIGAHMNTAGTISFSVVLNGSTVRTGSVVSTDPNKRVFRVPITPLAVVPTDTFRIDFTGTGDAINGSGASPIQAAYCDAIMRGQVQASGQMTSGGSFWLTSDNTRVAGIFPLPWLPALPTGYGANASIGTTVGTLIATVATATPQITLTQAVAAGKRIVVVVGGRNSAAVASAFAADRSNTGGVASQRQAASPNNTVAIGYVDVTTPLQVGDKITATFSGSVGPSIEGIAFVGNALTTGSAVDVAANGGSVSTLTSGTIGPTSNMAQDQELAVVAFQLGSAATAFSIGGGWTQVGTLLKTSGATSGDRGLAVAALPLSEAKALTATGSWSPGTNYDAVIASFRA